MRKIIKKIIEAITSRDKKSDSDVSGTETAEGGETSKAAPRTISLENLLGISKEPEQELELRIIGLFSSVEEEKIAELIQVLLYLNETNRILPEGEERKPIQFYLNTYGGSADDMFSIYDVMNFAKTRCDVVTCGLGKVMSAGVLLLAAGTKGKRRIGANCRVMIHSVIGGHHGAIHDLENEMEEVRWVQEQYNKALCAETDLTPRMLKKLMSRNVNVYLTAQEAVEYGIADIIV